MPEIGSTCSSSEKTTELLESVCHSTVEAEKLHQSAEDHMNHHKNEAEGCSTPNGFRVKHLGGSSSPLQPVGEQICIYSHGGGCCEPLLEKKSVGSECLDSSSVNPVDVLSTSDKSSGGASPIGGAEEQHPTICLQNEVGDVSNGLSLSQDVVKDSNLGHPISEPLCDSVSQGMLSGPSEEMNMIGQGHVTSEPENLYMTGAKLDARDWLKRSSSPEKVEAKYSAVHAYGAVNANSIYSRTLDVTTEPENLCMTVAELDAQDRLKGTLSPEKYEAKYSCDDAYGAVNHNSTHSSRFECSNNESGDAVSVQVTKGSSIERCPSGTSGGCTIGNVQSAIVGCVSVSNSERIVQPGPSMEYVTKDSVLDQLATLQADASKSCGNQGQTESGQETAHRDRSGEPSRPIHETPCKESNVKAESSVKSKTKYFQGSGQGRRKTPKIVVKSAYTLRSSSGSMKAQKPTGGKDAMSETGNNMENVSNGGKGRKKKRQMHKKSHNEFSRMRIHLRYLLHRIRYAQNLIDAYSSEGWRGQSLEKLKPEKEIQHAKLDINSSKLKIRCLFQRLGTMSAEGRFPDSLFDSDGLLDSEDIYCAKCGSKELASNNDIILCDGACDRGFHQLCLEPPLRTEDVPPGDEGWLCPACDCKIDCTDLLNDSQGTKLSINDGWEKVFPEATMAAGSAQDNCLGLPSDDSDDSDYDPDSTSGDDSNAEGSKLSSDESDFSSASEDLAAVHNDDPYLGLPSDDSEDDDFDPNNEDADNQAKQESSSSDFTSASENLAAAIDDDGSMSKEGPSELSPERDDSAPISGKKRVERLDYKKLYDETYANAGSSSSDDEDWKDAVEPKRRKNEEGKKRKYGPRKCTRKNEEEKDVVAQKRRKYAPRKCALASVRGDVPADAGGSRNMATNTSNTPRKSRQSPNLEGSNNKMTPACTNSPKLGPSAGDKSRQPYKKFGEAVTQRLHSCFKENQYPDHLTKEKIAEELGITLKQVSKWFENARWSFNHSAPVEATTSHADSKGRNARSCRRGTGSLNQKDNTGSGAIGLSESEHNPIEASNDKLQNNDTDSGNNKLEVGESNAQKTKPRIWVGKQRKGGDKSSSSGFARQRDY